MSDTSMSDASMSARSQTLTALFDTEAEADRAVARLKAAGIADSSIRVTQGGSGETTTGATGYDDRQKGFFESLGDFFFPDEDRYTYAEGLARGGYLVTVSNFNDGHYDTVVDILDDEGSVDLEARETEWRSSGWSGYQGSDVYNEDEYNRGRSGLSPAAAGMGAAAMAGAGMTSTAGTVYDDGMRSDAMGSGLDAGAVGTRTDVRDDAYGSAGDDMSRQTTRTDDMTGTTGMGTMGAAGTSTDVSGDETVKVVEESLRVGKREAEGGRVRVRSYVREQPVSADVQLRSTRVFVERRPVDRAVGAGDVTFQDRTIEAREHVEEAVVAKEARVVEEIGLRQESETHTETISDTVRKTEVEIEDERTGEVTRVTGDATTDATTGTTRTDRDRI